MAICTVCRKEFEDESLKVCPDDGGKLVEELPYQTIQGPDGNVWVEIASVGTSDEARLMQGYLESEEIPAEIESLKFDEMPANFGQLGDIRIYVNSANEKRALQLLQDREDEADDLREGELETDDGPVRIDE